MKLAQLVYQLHKVARHVDADYLRRQVRYWTATGLVDEEEELQDQPRRHREYDTRHLYRAALLLELAKYSIPRAIMQQVVLQIPSIAEEYRQEYDCDPFEDAANGTNVLLTFYLLSGSTSLGGGQPLPELRIERMETHKTKENPFTASWIMIDLNRVLAPLT